MCDGCKKSNKPSVYHKFWSIWYSIVQVCSLTIECLVYQCVPNTDISGQFESILLTILQDPNSSSLNGWSSMHGVVTLYNCWGLLFASPQHRSTHFLAWPSMSWNHEEMCASSFPDKVAFFCSPRDSGFKRTGWPGDRNKGEKQQISSSFWLNMPSVVIFSQISTFLHVAHWRTWPTWWHIRTPQATFTSNHKFFQAFSQQGAIQRGAFRHGAHGDPRLRRQENLDHAGLATIDNEAVLASADSTLASPPKAAMLNSDLETPHRTRQRHSARTRHYHVIWLHGTLHRDRRHHRDRQHVVKPWYFVTHPERKIRAPWTCPKNPDFEPLGSFFFAARAADGRKQCKNEAARNFEKKKNIFAKCTFPWVRNTFLKQEVLNNMHFWSIHCVFHLIFCTLQLWCL